MDVATAFVCKRTAHPRSAHRTTEYQQEWPEWSDISSAPAHNRAPGMRLASSGKVSKHSIPDLRQRMSTELTKTAYDNPHEERILNPLPAALFNIRGNYAGLGSAHEMRNELL